MTPLDEFAPNYRRAADMWKEAPTLVKHYQALAAKYDGNDHGILECIKSFIECICLTVLGEYGKSMSTATPTTTELLVECLKTLGLKNAPGVGELGAILKAHNKLADSLSATRNACGPLAHGKDGFAECLTENQCRIYLLTGDAIVAILVAALEGTEPDLQHTREPYDRFTHLHRRIDMAVSMEAEIDEVNDEQILVVRISAGTKDDAKEFRVEPSRLLYALDRTAYIDVLKAAEIADAIASVSSTIEALPQPSAPPQETRPQAVPASTYVGIFSDFKDGLREQLASLGLSSASGSNGSDLLDSILATADANAGTDWADRPSLQARMKVAIRRLLTGVGVGGTEAERVAEHLVSWLRMQRAGIGDNSGNSNE